MNFPALFRRERSSVARREAHDHAEKLIAESFRMLSQLCARMADLVESQRLSRSGYEDQGRFLERLDDTTRSRKQAP